VRAIEKALGTKEISANSNTLVQYALNSITKFITIHVILRNKRFLLDVRTIVIPFKLHTL